MTNDTGGRTADHDARAERLAQGFIEATTEYDFAVLPSDLRADLRRVAKRLLLFAEARLVAGEVVVVDTRDRDARPCMGRNANVCVAEGCYGEACTRVIPPAESCVCDAGVVPRHPARSLGLVVERVTPIPPEASEREAGK